MKDQTQENSEGMVYRGREDRVHIADGQRAGIGEHMARELEDIMREDAREMADSADEALLSQVLPLCPGCYMTVIVNMAASLAKANGQSLSELGNTLAGEFARLAAGGPDRIESVHVIRDDSCGMEVG